MSVLHPALCILLQELEALRAEGKIKSYGLATWDAFRTPPDALLVSASGQVEAQHTWLWLSHAVGMQASQHAP